MADLQSRLDELTGGAARGLPVEREVEHLSLWLLDALDGGAGPRDELVFELRTPRRGGSVDSCEIDLGGSSATTTSLVLSRLARSTDSETLHACAAHLLAEALDRVDPTLVTGERGRAEARVGDFAWHVESPAGR